MTIQDYILDYKVNGECVCNLFDYYERFIKPLDNQFKRYSFGVSKLVLCWFKDHEDKNPSLGYIKDSRHKGQHLYHCFGCGKTGNVIRLHQIIEAQYHNKQLTEEEACKELANLFDIPLGEFDEYSEEDYEGRFRYKLIRVDKLSKQYTATDYKRELLEIRKSAPNRQLTNKELSKVNAECVKMIASNKYLLGN